MPFRNAPRRLPTIMVLVALLSTGAMAGCLRDDGATAAPGDGGDAQARWADYLADPATHAAPNVTETPPGADAGTSVVAVIDSGINPFHAAFRRPETTAPGSVPVPAVDATTGQAARYAPVPSVASMDDPAAHAFTDAIEARSLYRLAGTPFFYYGFEAHNETLDENGHGTHAAASLLQGDPDTYVVVIRADSTHERTAEALRWASAQPWIDIVSVSRGILFNGLQDKALALRNPNIEAQAQLVVDASRAVWDAGKLLFVSAGNDPTLAATDPYGGPLACVVVGGYDPYWHGETVIAAKGAEIVGHFSVDVARHDAVEGTIGTGGTSFATPMAAGVTANALRTARDALGHAGGMQDGLLILPRDAPERSLDNHAVRAAINATAAYPELDQRYDPTQSRPDAQGGDDATGIVLGAIETAFQASIPINPAAPWLQMGWGLVGPDQRASLAQALVQNADNDKPEAAKIHMAQLTRLRIQQWQGTQAMVDDIVPR